MVWHVLPHSPLEGAGPGPVRDLSGALRGQYWTPDTRRRAGGRLLAGLTRGAPSDPSG